jgi:hypothetical protein
MVQRRDIVWGLILDLWRQENTNGLGSITRRLRNPSMMIELSLWRLFDVLFITAHFHYKSNRQIRVSLPPMYWCAQHFKSSCFRGFREFKFQKKAVLCMQKNSASMLRTWKFIESLLRLWLSACLYPFLFVVLAKVRGECVGKDGFGM